MISKELLGLIDLKTIELNNIFVIIFWIFKISFFRVIWLTVKLHNLVSNIMSNSVACSWRCKKRCWGQVFFCRNFFFKQIFSLKIYVHLSWHYTFINIHSFVRLSIQHYVHLYFLYRIGEHKPRKNLCILHSQSLQSNDHSGYPVPV